MTSRRARCMAFPTAPSASSSPMSRSWAMSPAAELLAMTSRGKRTVERSSNICSQWASSPLTQQNC